MIIYIATNLVNGKQYIGLTTKTVEKRWKEHQYETKANRFSLLHKAIKKYGANAFSVRELASPIKQNRKALCELESDLIFRFKTKTPHGYNLTDGGEGLAGLIFTDTHRYRLGFAQIGNTKAKGTIRSKEYKHKMSLALKGRTFSKETLLSMSKGQKGNKNNLGHKHNEETRQKLRDAWVRRKKNLEVKVSRVIGENSIR